MAKPNLVQDIRDLERQLEAMLSTIKRLNEENLSLKSRQEALVNERASLVARNEQARARVEAMISRLKALEEGA